MLRSPAKGCQIDIWLAAIPNVIPGRLAQSVLFAPQVAKVPPQMNVAGLFLQWLLHASPKSSVDLKCSTFSLGAQGSACCSFDVSCVQPLESCQQSCAPIGHFARNASPQSSFIVGRQTPHGCAQPCDTMQPMKWQLSKPVGVTYSLI